MPQYHNIHSVFNLAVGYLLVYPGFELWGEGYHGYMCIAPHSNPGYASNCDKYNRIYMAKCMVTIVCEM